MTVLPWGDITNLENSLKDFIDSQISSNSLQVLGENGELTSVDVNVGWEVTDDWSLPVISFYCDDKDSIRSFVGNNKRIKEYFIIIDIRALYDGQRQDLADWLEEKINDGFDFYEYSPNSSNPDSPTKTKTGYVSIDFVTNEPIRLSGTVDIYDKYRQNITINCQIQEV